jgi:hypothetical protein
MTANISKAAKIVMSGCSGLDDSLAWQNNVDNSNYISVIHGNIEAILKPLDTQDFNARSSHFLS